MKSQEKFSSSRRDSGTGKHESSQQDYFKEYVREPLHAERVHPSHYTKDMYESDTRDLNKWFDYEMRRKSWSVDEAIKEADRRWKVAQSSEEQQEALRWRENTMHSVFKEFEDRLSKCLGLKYEATYVFYNKRRSTQHGRKQSGQGEARGNSRSDEFTASAKPEAGSKKQSPDKKANLNAEEIALSELGISKNEYRQIQSVQDLSDSELIRFATKLFASRNEKSEIKSAYLKRAKEWHSDTGNTTYGIGASEIKMKVANNIYSEYNKRFGG